VALTDELEQRCKDQLGGHQRPREFAFAQSLPRTETGKLLRREVRDHYRKRVEAEGAP
jgi:acyl-coenzyme A synthetase/AMP-(fatty) acid ligase